MPCQLLSAEACSCVCTVDQLCGQAVAHSSPQHLSLALEQSCAALLRPSVLGLSAVCPRLQGVLAKAAPVDQFVVRAHFAAGQLVSKLSSGRKGQALVDAVLEAVGSIMRGVDIAATNPRWALVCRYKHAVTARTVSSCCQCHKLSSQLGQHKATGREFASACRGVVCVLRRYSHLIYNGSVHYWHAARPLQCDKLRHHLLLSQERLCLVGGMACLDGAVVQPACGIPASTNRTRV